MSQPRMQVETQGKGTVVATNAVETQGKGGVLATNAVETQGKGTVVGTKAVGTLSRGGSGNTRQRQGLTASSAFRPPPVRRILPLAELRASMQDVQARSFPADLLEEAVKSQ